MERGVYIWGTGKVAAEYLDMGELRPERVLGFIESRRSKETFWGKPVYEPGEVAGRDFDYILVCLRGFSDEICRTAEAWGLPVDRMIFVEGFLGPDGTSIREKYPSVSVRVIGKTERWRMSGDSFPACTNGIFFLRRLRRSGWLSSGKTPAISG